MGHYDSCRESEWEMEEKRRKKWRREAFVKAVLDMDDGAMDEFLDAFYEFKGQHEKLIGTKEQIKMFDDLNKAIKKIS